VRLELVFFEAFGGAGAGAAVAVPSLPSHDREVALYAIAGIVLLVLGTMLVLVARRRGRKTQTDRASDRYSS
jgi:hypothetical protein